VTPVTEVASVGSAAAVDEELVRQLTERAQGRGAAADRRGWAAGQVDEVVGPFVGDLAGVPTKTCWRGSTSRTSWWMERFFVSASSRHWRMRSSFGPGPVFDRDGPAGRVEFVFGRFDVRERAVQVVRGQVAAPVLLEEGERPLRVDLPAPGSLRRVRRLRPGCRRGPPTRRAGCGRRRRDGRDGRAARGGRLRRRVPWLRRCWRRRRRRRTAHRVPGRRANHPPRRAPAGPAGCGPVSASPGARVELTWRGHREVDGMIEQHAALARGLAERLGLSGTVQGDTDHRACSLAAH
jgi:hypothetical protein